MRTGRRQPRHHDGRRGEVDEPGSFRRIDRAASPRSPPSGRVATSPGRRFLRVNVSFAMTGWAAKGRFQPARPTSQVAPGTGAGPFRKCSWPKLFAKLRTGNRLRLPAPWRRIGRRRIATADGHSFRCKFAFLLTPPQEEWTDARGGTRTCEEHGAARVPRWWAGEAPARPISRPCPADARRRGSPVERSRTWRRRLPTSRRGGTRRGSLRRPRRAGRRCCRRRARIADRGSSRR